MHSNMLTAKLYDANMLNANLQDVVGLISQNLARSMLEGAILPDNVVRFEAIDSALKSIQHARKIYSAAIILGIYMCWQAWTSLPNDKIGINSIGLVAGPLGFVFISGILFIIMVTLFSIYLNRVWCSYGTFPAVFPHGDDTDIYPDSWINLNLYSYYVHYGQTVISPKLIMIHFINWWIFPVIMIVVTAGFARFGNITITFFQLTLTLLLISIAITGYYIAEDNLSRSNRLNIKKIKYIRFVVIIAILIIGALFKIWPNWLPNLIDSPQKPRQHYSGLI